MVKLIVTDIWRRRPGPTLAQVLAYCLAVLSHHRNQCWLLTSEVLTDGFLPRVISQRVPMLLFCIMSGKNIFLKLLPHLRGASELRQNVIMTTLWAVKTAIADGLAPFGTGTFAGIVMIELGSRIYKTDKWRVEIQKLMKIPKNLIFLKNIRPENVNMDKFIITVIPIRMLLMRQHDIWLYLTIHIYIYIYVITNRGPIQYPTRRHPIRSSILEKQEERVSVIVNSRYIAVTFTPITHEIQP